jgi:hypothetical protein
MRITKNYTLSRLSETQYAVSCCTALRYACTVLLALRAFTPFGAIFKNLPYDFSLQNMKELVF